MMTSLTASAIPSSYSRVIARVLQLHERDLPLLLENTGISSREFLQEDLLITARQQIQILENALLISGDAAFGLKLGKQLTPPAHGTMGFLANSSPDLLTALRGFQTYSPTRTNFTRVEVVINSAQEEMQWLECYHHIDIDVSPDIARCLSEAAAMSLFESAKYIIGRDLDEASTYFSHEAPQYIEQYSDYMPGDVQFGQAHTFVRLPLSVCLIPNVSANHENYLLAMRQCEAMMNQLRTPKDSFKYQVQKIMLSSPPSQLSEASIAAQLFVSKRTLARRLIKEDTNYRELRDEILAQQASTYLSDGRLSVEAIATLLNYHDSSNFRRAFKRWFGISPDQFRKNTPRHV